MTAAGEKVLRAGKRWSWREILPTISVALRCCPKPLNRFSLVIAGRVIGSVAHSVSGKLCLSVLSPWFPHAVTLMKPELISD